METFNFGDYQKKLGERQKQNSKITNERQVVVKEFLETLNSQRNGKFKPLTPARLGKMFQFMTTGQLKSFLATCKDANNFSAYFWWAMNPKNYAPSGTTGDDESGLPSERPGQS